MTNPATRGRLRTSPPHPGFLGDLVFRRAASACSASRGARETGSGRSEPMFCAAMTRFLCREMGSDTAEPVLPLARRFAARYSCGMPSLVPSDAMERFAEMWRQAYQAGWRDGIAATREAANKLLDDETPSAEPSCPAPLPSVAGVEGHPIRSGASGPSRETYPEAIDRCLRHRSGVGGAEIAGWLNANGFAAEGASVRTALRRMLKTRRVVRRDGKYFRTGSAPVEEAAE